MTMLMIMAMLNDQCIDVLIRWYLELLVGISDFRFHLKIIRLLGLFNEWSEWMKSLLDRWYLYWFYLKGKLSVREYYGG